MLLNNVTRETYLKKQVKCIVVVVVFAVVVVVVVFVIVVLVVDCRHNWKKKDE